LFRRSSRQRSIIFRAIHRVRISMAVGQIDATCRAHAGDGSANQVRMWLSVLAYNLGNLWRRLVLPARIGAWSLTSLQRRVMKTGGRLIKHARYYWLLLAESHLTRRLFGSMLRRDRDTAVAGGIDGAQSGVDFGDEIGREGISVWKTANFGCFVPTRGRTGPLRHVESPFGLKPGSNFAFAKRLVSAQVCFRIQNGNSG
jgi:Transposase DDE domain group 1